MIDDPDPDVASRPLGPNDAQRQTYSRLFKGGQWSSAKLAPELTVDGLAVAYFGIDGQTNLVHIGRAGELMERRDGAWVTIAGTDLNPQLSLGV